MEDTVGILVNNVTLDYFDIKSLMCTNKTIKSILESNIKAPECINTRLYACIYHNLINIYPFQSFDMASDLDSGIRILLKGKRIYCYTSLTSLSILEDDVIPEENVHILASTYKHAISCSVILHKNKPSRMHYGNKHVTNAVDLNDSHLYRGEIYNLFKNDLTHVKEVHIYYYNVNKPVLNKLIEEIIKLLSVHVPSFSVNIQQENSIDNIVLDD